jgi:hypothetical protein
LEILAEEEKQQKAEKQVVHRKHLLTTIEPEVPMEKKGEYVTCLVRLCCGKKFTRRLALNSTVQNLYNYIETLALEGGIVPDKYLAAVDYIEGPSKLLEDKQISLEEAGLTRFSSFTVRLEEIYEQ